MNLSVERQKLIEELNAIEDIHLIKAIKELLSYAKAAKEDKALKPFSDKELINRIENSEEDIKNGRVSSISQVRKELKSW